MKFKTKEDEAEYIEETSKLIFNQLKTRFIDAIITASDNINYLKLQKNLMLSEDQFCVDTLDQLKRKILVANESIENKRVLLYVTLYLNEDIVETNKVYKRKDDYNNHGVEFVSLLNNVSVGIALGPNAQELIPDVNIQKIHDTDKNNLDVFAKPSAHNQNNKQLLAVQKRASTILFKNDSYNDAYNNDQLKVKNMPIVRKTMSDIKIEHIDVKSLQTFTSIIYEITNKLPKYTLLLITLKQSSDITIPITDLYFLAEYLQNELETPIHIETGPNIDDYKNKIENEEFEDNSVIVLKNHGSFESYNTFEFDTYGLKHNKLWKAQEIELKTLQTYADVYIEDDTENNVWDYKPRTEIIKIPKFIGFNIGKGLEFIEKIGPNFRTFKNREQWPSQLAIIGGDFSFDKLEFLVNFADFFDLIVLVGSFSVLMSLTQSQINSINITSEIISAIFYTKENIKNYMYKIKVPNSYVTVSHLDDLQNFGDREAYSEEYVQTYKELYSLESNSIKLNSDTSEQFITLEDLIDIAYEFNSKVLDVSPQTIEELVTLIDQHENVWLFDSISLNPIDRYCLSTEYFIETLHNKYNVFDIDPSASELKSKLSICGDDIITQINQFNYYKKKKSIAKIQSRLEKEERQKKRVKFDSDDEEDGESDESGGMDDMSDDGSERSDQEDIIENCKLVSNNVFKDTAYVLRLLNGRHSDGDLISY